MRPPSRLAFALTLSLVAGPVGFASAQEEEPAAEVVGAEPATDGEAPPEVDRAAYAAALRDVVTDVRGRVTEKIAAKIEAGQAQTMDRIAAILSLIAWGGLLLLFMPLVLRRRYPGQGGVLMKYSLVAGLLFFLTVNLFAAVLVTMRATQGALGRYTNPQIVLVEATFDLIAAKADDMVEIGPLLIEPTLASLSGDTDEPVVSIMLDNVQKLRSDLTVFGAVGDFFGALSWVSGLLPLALMAVAIFLFVQAARPTLVEIVKLPERAALGERGVGRQAIRSTLRNVWAEVKATFGVIAILLALSLLAGFILGKVLQPAIEVFITYLSLAFLYVQLSEQASSFWILFSLMGTLLFLVINLAVVLAASLLFLARAQKALQARFRHRAPFGEHRRLWTWGALAALWSQLLPLLYITAALPAIGWLAERTMTKFVLNRAPEAQNWPFVLATGPAIFVVTFVLVFWLFRGMRSLGFLARYKVAGQASAAISAVDDALAAAPEHAA